MAVTCYLAVDELREELNSDSVFASSAYERAIKAASRWIDRRCQRHFWLADAPTSRLIRPTSRVVIRPGDFPDPSDTTVEVDLAGDGSFTVLNPTAWQAEPFTPEYGWPYERITPTGLVSWPMDVHRATVRVTTRWGWPEVPSEVEQACSILSVGYLLGKEIVSMHDGHDIDSQGPTNPVAMAEHLLRPYLPRPSLDPALPSGYSPLG